jgi:hypothetical protein
LSRWWFGLAAAVLAGSILAGCQSTQDKARQVQNENAALLAAEQRPLKITERNKEVDVLGSTILHDQYGDAVVVKLRNNGKQPQVQIPIVVDLRDAEGKSVYSTALPGLDDTLNHVPLIGPGETVAWVNDQLAPSGVPKTAQVKVGQSEGTAPAQLPEIEVGGAKVESSPQGVLARGQITNKSQVDQLKLVVYAVAHRGGQVVAAGRGQFKNLKAGGNPGTYNIFFIGDPRGAEVSVTAPPSVLQ